MSHPDRPFTRPLAGVDQALGEGRARQPVELLDQLRERLDRLDQNHPSSGPRSTDRHEVRGQDATPDQGASADLAADQAAAAGQSQQASRPERSSLRKEGASPSRDDQPGDQGAGEPPPVSRPGQPAAADSVASGMADDGQYRVVQTGRTADGEPYRPWFADEPGSPWFVDPWFVE
jgi:hypothetical protein